MGQWRDAISKEIGDQTGLGPAEVAAILTETISALSVFCDLLAHVAMNLEGDVDIDAPGATRPTPPPPTTTSSPRSSRRAA